MHSYPFAYLKQNQRVTFLRHSTCHQCNRTCSDVLLLYLLCATGIRPKWKKRLVSSFLVSVLMPSLVAGECGVGVWMLFSVPLFC
ncbi:hypothetical protein EPI10_027524 [Gossypium australe]|uniref:Uncharacterized protein n=1 Tax=Gossypium australe TaxID=47621 RepID=A0A5B6UZM2_9ROSI|nr:hypothetical protein EPI10_027524 [Gossypium australe]